MEDDEILSEAEKRLEYVQHLTVGQIAYVELWVRPFYVPPVLALHRLDMHSRQVMTWLLRLSRTWLACGKPVTQQRAVRVTCR